MPWTFRCPRPALLGGRGLVGVLDRRVPDLCGGRLHPTAQVYRTVINTRNSSRCMCPWGGAGATPLSFPWPPAGLAGVDLEAASVEPPAVAGFLGFYLAFTG